MPALPAKAAGGQKLNHLFRARLTKKKGRAKCPPSVRTPEDLEFELQTKPGVERAFVRRIGVSVYSRRAAAAGLAKIGIGNGERALRKLIHAQQRLAVGEVEQVSSQADACPFRNPDWIIHVVVDATPVIGSAQRAASRSAVGGVVGAEWNFTGILVSRVREQVVDGGPGLEVY